MKRFLAAWVLLAINSVACADAVIEVGSGVVVTTIDRTEVKHGFFSSKKTRYVLPSGVHRVQVRYEQLFDLNSDNHDVVRSGMVELPDLNLADQQHYHLVLLDAPTTYAQAQHYAKTPTFALLDANQQVVVQTTAQAVAQPNLLESANKALGQVAAGVSGLTADEPTVMQRFKSMWEVATPDERHAMELWIKQHH